jgi:hypothetical protein
MFRLSFFTTLFVLFVALAAVAAPTPLQSPETSEVEVTAPEIEARDETHTLEKRKTGKVSPSQLYASVDC